MMPIKITYKATWPLPSYLAVIHRHFEKSLGQFDAKPGEEHLFLGPLDLVRLSVGDALAETIQEVTIIYSK